MLFVFCVFRDRVVEFCYCWYVQGEFLRYKEVEEVYQWVSRARVVLTFDADVNVVFNFLAAT